MTSGAAGAAHPAIDEAVPFLEALLLVANPRYYLEFRAITRQGKVYQYYHQIQNLLVHGIVPALPFHLDGKANIYQAGRYGRRGGRGAGDLV